MASKKTNPILKSGNARMQPIRATQPFQLLQGGPVRKSPSSSPTPRSATDARVNVRTRWSPDHRSSPDRSDRKSPNSPSVKVSNRRSPSPSIRRTSSLDTIAGPYLTGQWPRDVVVTNYQHAVRDKTTQTPDWSMETNIQQQQIKSNTKSGRSSTIADPGFNKMRQQIRRISKRHNTDKKERSPPVQGNHSALHQLAASQPRSASNPISIGSQSFGRTPRRQNSVEALNKEIEFISNNSSGNEPRLFQGITPPDGHRAPLPRSSTRSMETQTPQDMNIGIEVTREGNESTGSSHSALSSPVVEVLTPITRVTTDVEIKDAGVSPGPKYASSPRPNNSYTFKREPPEGAESVTAFKEQDIQQKVFPSCPDIKKVHFYPKSNPSAFVPLSGKENFLQQCRSTALSPEQNNNTALHASPLTNLIPINSNNNNGMQTVQTIQTSNNIMGGIPILTTAASNADV